MQDIVYPGEKVATEEEFAPGMNTYADAGVIYSSAFGKVVTKDGAVNVESGAHREVRQFDKGMLVIGKVTDDMKNVTFIEIAAVNVGNRAFLALKDGKIIPPKQSPGMSRAPMGNRGTDNRFYETKEKLCGVGDTVLAKILFNDKDSYTLGILGEPYGVVYAKCSRCGEDLYNNEQRRILVCSSCGNAERRKISVLYGQPDKIAALFA